VQAFFFEVPWPRGFAIISVLILISSSLNALFLGTIGEYLGRIYRQVKRHPMSAIDRTINLINERSMHWSDVDQPYNFTQAPAQTSPIF